MPGDRHGWNSLDHYLGIHASCLRDFEHFVKENSLTFTVTGADTLRLFGRLHCTGGVYLDVYKILELNMRNQVRTSSYSYHAGIRRNADRPVFRYDNAYRYGRAGHLDQHHKHVLDASGRELSDPVWVGRDWWPTFAEILRELEDWWLETGQFVGE